MISTTISNPKQIQQQITQAIKYIKSDFPQEFNKWKSLPFQGSKQFESHLNTIEYVMTTQVYARLRSKILDELLIKLRFFSFNQSYLMNFQAFLMERFISFISRSFNMVFNLTEIYDENKIKNERIQKQRRQITQRYSIFVECLINIMRFCFGHNKSSQQKILEHENKGKFENEMLRAQQQSLKMKTNRIQIISRQSVIFLAQELTQTITTIFRFEILDVQRIYPLSFSTLTDGLLTFSNVGGSKFVEMVGGLVVRLVRKNGVNVWNKIQSQSESVNSDQFRKMRQLGRYVHNIMPNSKVQKLQQQDSQSKKCNLTNQKNSQSPSQICKSRLLIFLQKLLAKLTGYKYNFNADQNNNECSWGQQGIIIEMIDDGVKNEAMSLSENRIMKWMEIVNELLGIVVKECFGQASQEAMMRMKATARIQNVDNSILLCLTILSISLTPSTLLQHQKPTQTQQIISSKFLNLLQLSAFTSLHYNSTASFIHRHLHQLFLTKFKLLINKNKTISTQKTLLLRQLTKLVKYVSFQTMQYTEFVDMICVKLRELFIPNERDMNKPLIIAIDASNRLQGTSITGQAVPLTPLQPYHSCFTYPITLTSLKQSLTFQQTRHVLDEIRLFHWFENSQENLKLFKQLLIKMQFHTKLTLLQYFLQQLMRIKVMESENFYGLEMSLGKFYQVLILEFYIDTLLGKQTGLLDHQNYTFHKEIYEKSVISKMKIIYQLIVSNIDMKKLLISNKQEELVIFYSLRIMYNINHFFCCIMVGKREERGHGKRAGCSKLMLLYRKVILAENLILNLSHRTYLLQLFLTTSLLEFSAPQSISQSLKPLQSTLIHRNAGSITSKKKQCNLQFMKNLIKISSLKHKQAQQLVELYLSKDFIINLQANSIISLLFPLLSPQSMRKCLLSIKNWPIIFLTKFNIQLLSNQPLLQQPKQSLFHANDNDNVTVSNALGVIVLQLGQKWMIELQFKNPRKQILIDAMINLIQVNNKLIFWKRFFFENILLKLVSILRQIDNFINSDKKGQQSGGRRILLYQRIHSKIYQLLSAISPQHYKYSTQINQSLRNNINQLKEIVTKQYNYLKRQCFVHQKYQYLDKYKLANSLLQKINLAISFKQQQDSTLISNQ